jgi:hypothetical protein
MATEPARALFEALVGEARRVHGSERVATGQFGAMMQVRTGDRGGGGAGTPAHGSEPVGCRCDATFPSHLRRAVAPPPRCLCQVRLVNDGPVTLIVDTDDFGGGGGGGGGGGVRDAAGGTKSAPMTAAAGSGGGGGSVLSVRTAAAASAATGE